MAEEKELAPAGGEASKSEADILDEITPKNRLFLIGILDGKKVFDAYRDAGYEGDRHAAYVLKSRLDKELSAFAAAHGVSLGGLKAEIARLNGVPVHIPVTGISVQDKLALLRLQEKVLASSKDEAPKISMIQINRYEDKKKVEEVNATVIDVTPIQQPVDK